MLSGALLELHPVCPGLDTRLSALLRSIEQEHTAKLIQRNPPYALSFSVRTPVTSLTFEQTSGHVVT